MASVNARWASMEGQIEELTKQFNRGTADLIQAMSAKKVGRKFNEKGWETRFNRALYEVEVYYAARLPDGLLVDRAPAFIAAFERLCRAKPDFVDSIEASTKNIDKYFTRFTLYRDMINDVMDLKIVEVPVPARI